MGKSLDKNQKDLKLMQYLLIGLLVSLLTLSICADALLETADRLNAALIVSMIKLLPLLAFIPLLARRKANNYVWFAYLLIPYFCWSSIKVFAPGLTGWTGIIECVIYTLLFSSAIACTRILKRIPVTKT
ncbi:MAG: DUF2069 domain-containing protein [Gammaproteobacteria bacterium]|nr:DUF2069 domain-containing protein [Gammaproteobacteria bacterium]